MNFQNENSSSFLGQSPFLVLWSNSSETVGIEDNIQENCFRANIIHWKPHFMTKIWSYCWKFNVYCSIMLIA